MIRVCVVSSTKGPGLVGPTHARGLRLLSLVHWTGQPAAPPTHTQLWPQSPVLDEVWSNVVLCAVEAKPHGLLCRPMFTDFKASVQIT